MTDDPQRKTLTFICATTDEAFAYIKQFAPENYWAQIICLTPDAVTLHLRPLEEKDH